MRSEVQVFPGPPARPRPDTGRGARRWPTGVLRPALRSSGPLGRAAPREGRVLGGISSVGRAPGLQPGGHRFEPGILQSAPGATADRAVAPGRRRSSFPNRLRFSDLPAIRSAVEFESQSFFHNGSVWQFQGACSADGERTTKDPPPLSGGARLRGQVTKGARWMPWRRKAMKDVADCDKPRGAVSRLRSGDFRMG